MVPLHNITYDSSDNMDQQTVIPRDSIDVDYLNRQLNILHGKSKTLHIKSNHLASQDGIIYQDEIINQEMTEQDEIITPEMCL